MVPADGRDYEVFRSILCAVSDSRAGVGATGPDPVGRFVEALVDLGSHPHVMVVDAFLGGVCSNRLGVSACGVDHVDVRCVI